MRWSEYTATLPEDDQHQLIIALGGLLQEARRVSAVTKGDGALEVARQHLLSAGQHYLEVMRILFVPA